MKKIFITIVAVFSLFIVSCEEEVNGVDLLYVEEIVIRGVVTAGDTLNSILIYKTLSPLEYYSFDKVEIRNADAKVLADGREYSLNYRGNGIYGNDSLIAATGKTYELQVRWNGKYAYASTQVPPNPVLDTIFPEAIEDEYGIYNFGIFALIKPQNDINYLGFIRYLYGIGNRTETVWYISELYRSQDTSSNGLLKVLLYEFTAWESDWKKEFNLLHGDDYFGVEAYDKAFYDYYITRNDGARSDDVFGSSGTNIRWNIQGDGVGMFIGSAITQQKIVLR